MKMLIALSFLTLIASAPSQAQDDDTIAFKHGLPETGEDTATVVGLRPDGELVQISAEQVPQALYKHLNSEPQFKNWANHVLLLDKKTERYWLRMKRNDTLHTYVFAPDGTTVSVDVQNISDQTR
jgi:hypothetical protein